MQLFLGTVNKNFESAVPVIIVAPNLKEAEQLCSDYDNFEIISNHEITKPQVITYCLRGECIYYVPLRRSLGHKLLKHAKDTNRTHAQLIEDILTDYSKNNCLKF